MIAEPANASSLTWTMEFVDHDWQAEMGDWWFLQVDLLQCSEGYANQQYTIWAPDGRPVALARQVMTVFA
jgi:acyl-CoA thioesterase